MPLYGRLDVDGIGDKLELLLLKERVEEAHVFQQRVREALRSLQARLVSDLAAEVLYVGCDDILFLTASGTSVIPALRTLAAEFTERTTCTFSCGLADTLSGALDNLRIAKLSGKARIVGKHGVTTLANAVD